MYPSKNKNLLIHEDKKLRFTQFVVDHMDTAAFWADNTGNLVYVNEAAARQLGYSTAEMSEMTVMDIDTGMNADKWITCWQELTKTGSLSFETQHKMRSAELRNVEVQVTYVVFDGEEYACAFSRDITQEKQFTQAIRDAEERFAVAFRNSPDIVIFTTIPEGKIMEINDRITTLAGYTREEVLGKTTVELDFWWNHHDRENYIRNLILYGKVLSMEADFRCKSGEPMTGLISGEIFEQHDKKYLLSLVHDITERKKIENRISASEKKYRMLTETMKDVVWSIDLVTTKFNYISPSVKQLRGYTPEEFMELPFQKAVNPTNNEILIAAIKEKFEKFQRGEISSTNYFIEEHEEIHKDGSSIWTEIVAHFRLNEQTGHTELHGVTRDISERKSAEDALKASEARMRELNATKDKFFSIIAHDLKNPFNSIIGFSEMLRDDASSMDIKEIINYASYIHISATQTMQLLENLLGWARMQQDRIPVVPKNLLIYELTNDVYNLLKQSADQKDLTFSNLIPQHLIIQTDEEMLKTILRNLLSNAVKFTKSGGKIEISSQSTDNETIIIIKDTGIGIPDTQVEQLFTIDKGFSTRGTRNEKGTGLGLILCKEFVEKLGGKIWAESIPDNGSIFFFTIPNHQFNKT